MDFMSAHGMRRWLRSSSREDAAEHRLDEQLKDSFPASDPPSFSPLPAKRSASAEWRSMWANWGNESMMLHLDTMQAAAANPECGLVGAKEDAMSKHTPRPCELATDGGHLQVGAKRSERDHWSHEFRNALGNTTIAASAVRFEVRAGHYDQVDALMRQIEEGCERCLRLLGTMPP